MDVSTASNSWVQSYLDALLSVGLSSEHAHAGSPEAPIPEAARKGDKEDRSVAKYFVNQILSYDEDGIKGAWRKSTLGQASNRDEKDARMEYLSWRVWGIKRKRATAGAALERERLHMVEEEEEEANLAQLTTQSMADLSKLAPNPISEQGTGTSRLEMADMLKGMSQSNLSLTAPSFSKASSRFLMSTVGEIPSFDEDATPEGVGSTASMASFRPSLGLSRGASAKVEEQPSHMLDRFKPLYIVLISMHGLVRGKDMELGKDPDTGGQVKYVVELASALGRIPSVMRVDLLTRLVDDPKVDQSYHQAEEALLPPRGDHGLGGAFVVRIPCGPKKTYLRKEELWPHVREFSDRSIAYISNMLAKLREVDQGAELYVVHGHYADAGEAAALIAHTLGADMVLTGHSLGRNKRDHLIKQGTMSRAEIEATYQMSRRIEGEERALDAAMEVFTSTQEEVEKQWGLYDGYNNDLASALRNRPCKGYHVPHMNVIPPGLDFSNLKVKLPVDPWEAVLGPQAAATAHAKEQGALTPSPSASAPSGGVQDVVAAAADALKSSASLEEARASQGGGSAKGDQASPGLSRGGSVTNQQGMQTPHLQEPPIWREIGRFLRNPRKPVILALCRADAKKNVTALIHAYGQNKLLREIANLVLVLGNRDSIDGLAPGSASVMTSVLKLVDAYDLYGSVAYPKHHQQAEVSDIYLLTAATKGVFVNPALQEPFGLTLIEAAAHGVPTVATKHGGPVDIVHTLKNGLLVEPTEPAEIADCLIKIVTNPEIWEKFSASGRTNIVAYSWPSHCLQYLKGIESEKSRPVIMPTHSLRVSHSLSFDDLSQLNRASDAALENRTMSMPPAKHGTHAELSLQHQGSVGRNRDSSAGGAATPGSRTGSRRPSTDSYTEDPRELVAGNLVQLGYKRAAGYVVFCADDEADLAQVAELLRADGGARAAALAQGCDAGSKTDDAAVGFGLVTTLSYKEAQLLLEPSRRANGVATSPTSAAGAGDAGSVLSKLDFLVCQAGSQVWHQRDDGAGMVCDDFYEHHIDFRWDPYISKQVLKRLVSSPGGWAKLPINKEGCAQLQLSKRSGPFHLQVNLSQPLPEATPSRKPALDVDLLISRLRCKLRKSGIRGQLLATTRMPGASRIAASGNEGAGAGLQPQLAVHLTPLRASRSLSLRYLAHRYKLDLSEFTVVMFTQSGGASRHQGAAGSRLPGSDLHITVHLDENGKQQKGSKRSVPPSPQAGNSRRPSESGMGSESGAVVLGSSDANELLGGMQQVVLVPGRGKGLPGCRFKADLAAYADLDRIRVLNSL